MEQESVDSVTSPDVAPAASRLREDAHACFQAALRAVEPERLVADFLAAHPELTEGRRRIRLAAIGKAAPAMARGARARLGRRLAGGVLIVPVAQRAEAPAGFRVFGGGHPAPNEEGAAGARAVLELTRTSRPGDLLLCLISGGGSALMTLPPEGVTLADVQATTRALLRAGATIAELNCVRRHLDEVKGGRLARAAAPTPVLALALSDVVGDPLEVIASGPASPDPTSYDDAIAVLQRLGAWRKLPTAVRNHLKKGQRGEVSESPKPGDPCFYGTAAFVVGSNRVAAEAALREAEARGYRTLLLATAVTGEARGAGRVLGAIAGEVRRSGRPVAPPACLVAAGETTVTVRGKGRGGRNQELALGASFAIAGLEDVLVASLGTDGVDGPTDAAGALVTGDTLTRAAALGLSAERALADNDTYPFFEALGDLIVTGPTGTNVMDLQLLLVSAIP